MSVITIEVEQAQEETLINFLKTLPYVKVQTENPTQTPKADWRQLRGKYKGMGVSSETLYQENELEKEREKRQKTL